MGVRLARPTGYACPICGAGVHQEMVIPPQPEAGGIIWELWFCEGRCKWVSDWPGMPDSMKDGKKPIRKESGG